MATNTFNPAIFADICRLLAEGKSLKKICAQPGYPADATVRGWVIDDVGGCSAQYTRARDIGLDVMADDLLDISDTAVVGVIETDKVNAAGVAYTEKQRRDALDHRKLRVDTRKWYLSKIAPKRYGDRVAVDVTNANGIEDRLRAGRKRAGNA